MYVVPFFRPVTVPLGAGESNVIVRTGAPLTYAVIFDPVIGDPPSVNGACHCTVALRSPGTAKIVIGPNGATLVSVVAGCTGRSSGGRGLWVKSKSFARSPRIGTFSRTVGRGSGRPSVRGSSRCAAEEVVLDELEVRVEAERLVVDVAASSRTG